MTLLSEKKFVAHHVGGRGGVITLPLPVRFYEDVSLVIYEADQCACSKIIKRWPKAIVIPNAVSASNSLKKFNLNRIPSSSSLFDLDPREGSVNQELGRTDVVNERCFIPVEEAEIQTTAIDSLVSENTVPSPHWLGLDVQGAELEIIKGADNALINSLVALDVEISFRQVYKDAPTFAEIDSHLTRRGFLLADISMIRASSIRTPFVVRGGKMPFQGNALYLLNPASVSAENLERLLYLAFSACLVGQTEVAYEALVRSGMLILKDNKLLISKHLNLRDYLPSSVAGFLAEYLSICTRYPEFPPFWDDVVSVNRVRLDPASNSPVMNFLFKTLGLCSSYKEVKMSMASRKMQIFFNKKF